MRVPWLFLLLAPCLLAGACKEASTTAADGAAMEAPRCQAFATEHERLLNAPTDAAVVRKVVTLPALPGGDVPRPAPTDAPDGGL